MKKSTENEEDDLKGKLRETFFHNVEILREMWGIKTGELEAAAGVSKGYIARASKDERSLPGVEVMLRFSKALNVPIDLLLTENFEGSPTESILQQFINHLTADTICDAVHWTMEPEGEDDNNYIKTGLPYMLIDDTVRMTSNTYIVTREKDRAYGCYIKKDDDIWKIDILSVTENEYYDERDHYYTRELWIGKQGFALDFLCSTQEPALKTAIENLFKEAQLSNYRVQIADDTLDFIKKYTRE